ncbi:nucleotidyltransferase domain-containing protein [Amnibacterium setariae]|uniref:nucleotidyltransferase domain-containing protein n=1 Tax=Amnibacterium setariae TaxID=2306585 RepID=UPI0011C4A103|nr:2'-5' RNA ligase family protein [Amnibacterium setariae]
MRTCCVVLPLEPLEVGDVVDRAAWPAHVTLVGNAVLTDGATDTAAAVLRAFAAATPPLSGVVAEEAWFEPAASVRVDLVDAPALHVAHTALLTAFERHVEGYALLLPTHGRAGYRPHRTVTAGARPAPGDVLAFPEALLVELDPPGMPGRALILARWPLGGAAGATEVDAGEVHRVLDVLADAPRWVIGGWGVDALAGERTRPHHDLDLLVEADDLAAVLAALDRAGYRPGFVWSENRWQGEGDRLLPSAFAAVDDAGREVDVHAVRFDGDRPVPVSASSVVLPVGALGATGRIGGRVVRCATADAELVMHEGYPLPERQEADVALLRRLAAG